MNDERFSKYSSCNDFNTATISVFLLLLLHYSKINNFINYQMNLYRCTIII